MAVIAVVVVGVTAIALALTRTSAPPRLVPELQLSLLPRILCLMVTGKDDDRVNRLAPRSVRNFLQQTYPNARLVVLNHHPRTAVVPAAVSRVTEFRLPMRRAEHTLGDLRNMLMDMAASRSDCVVPWDDDDHRAPGFLATLAAHSDGGRRPVRLQHRLEHDTLSGFTWVASFAALGMPGVFLLPAGRRLRYRPVDVLEDAHAPAHLAAMGAPLVNNDAAIYVRYTHANNTSPFVVRGRQSVLPATGAHYRETVASAQQKAWAEAHAPPPQLATLQANR